MRYVIEKKSGCWNWRGATNGMGYAELSWRRRPELASRFVYTALVGAIPKGRHVCHQCDNPQCVNPEHLFLGSPKDNIQDSRKKGRWTDSHRNRWARKLTFEQAQEIRERWAAGELTTTLGPEFGVSHETIRTLVAGRTYLRP